MLGTNKANALLALARDWDHASSSSSLEFGLATNVARLSEPRFHSFESRATRMPTLKLRVSGALVVCLAYVFGCSRSGSRQDFRIHRVSRNF